MENKNFATFELITPENKMEEHLCPYCGANYYRINSEVSTLIGYSEIIKDGKVVSEDPNTYTTHCTCLQCNNDFKIVRKGRTYEIYKQ